MSNRFRSVLSQAFKYAISKGLRYPRNDNPVDPTIIKPEEVKRQRLSLEGFHKIFPHASRVTQNAMLLSLHTLQREADICNFKRKDIKEGNLCFQQQKSGEIRGQRYITRVRITPTVKMILNRCKDGILSPYIIHNSYQSKKKLWGKQMSPNSISQGFTRARERSGFYADLKPEGRPTFHEIRALGADLYKKGGMAEKYIKDMLGHKNIDMTKYYLSGHDVVYIDIMNAGLNIEIPK